MKQQCKSNCLVKFLSSRELSKHKNAFCALEMKPCEKILEDRATLLRKRQPCELSGHCRSTFLMVFSPDRKKIASTHGDHSVRITEISSGKCTHVLTGHPRTPWCIAFHPTFEDLLATGCLAGEVRIWDLRGGCSEVWRSGDGWPISSLTFHPLDHLLVIAIGQKLVFWNWTENEPFAVRETCHREQRVRWVKFDALGQHLYTAITRCSNLQYSTSVPEPSVQQAPWPQPYRDVVSDIIPRLGLPRQNALDIEDSQLSAYLTGTQQTQESDVDLVRPRSPLADDIPRSSHSRLLDGMRDYTDIVRRVIRNRQDEEDDRLMSDFEHGSTVRRMVNFSVHEPAAGEYSDQVLPEDSSRPEYWENMRTHALRYRRFNHPPLMGRSGFSRVAPYSQIHHDLVSQRFSDLRGHDEFQSTSNLSEPFTGRRRIEILLNNHQQISETELRGSDAFRNNSHRQEEQSSLFGNSVSSSGESSEQVTERPSQPQLSRSQPNAGITCVGNGPRCVICQNYCAPTSNASSTFPPRTLLPFHRRPFVEDSQMQNRTNAEAERNNESVFHNFSSLITPSSIETFGDEQVTRDVEQSSIRDSDLSWNSQDPAPADLNQATLSLSLPDSMDLSLDMPEINTASNALDNDVSMPTSVNENEPFSQTNLQERDSVMASLLREGNQRDYEENESTWSHGMQSDVSSSLWNPLFSMGPVSREVPYRWSRERFDRASPPRRLESEDDSEYRRRVEMLENIERRIEMLQAMRMRMQGLRTLQTRIQSVSAQEGRLRTLRSIQDRLQAMRALRERTQTLTALQGRIERLRDNLHNSRRQMFREGHRLLPGDGDFQNPVPLDLNDDADRVQAAVDRALAGAFNSSGEVSVTNNASNALYRIQRWDFSRGEIPCINNNSANIIIDRCRVHNDASCDISLDGRFIATLLPKESTFPTEIYLLIFSLMPDTLGRCLIKKAFGPNVVSISFSPLGRYVVVGFAAKRRSTWIMLTKQVIGQVYKLEYQTGSNIMMELQHVCDLTHPCDLDPRTHVSVNSIRWLPTPGAGLVYGTSRGDMTICMPSFDEGKTTQVHCELDSQLRRRNLAQLLTRGPTESISTQTNGRRLNSAGTQTDLVDADLAFV